MEQFEIYSNPRKNVIYERFLFFMRKQEEGESVDHFVNDLKNLAKNCEFDTQEESLIRDRIVLGISDLRLQERLLAKDDLNLDKAIQECRVNEVSKTQIKNLQEQGSINEIKRKYVKKDEKKNKKKEEKEQAETFLCYRCKENHGPRQCKAYGQKCRTCGLMNHFAKAGVRKVKEVNQQAEASSDDELKIHTVTVSRSKSLVESVNGVNCSNAWVKDIEICKQESFR